jgi:hypothetical protein
MRVLNEAIDNLDVDQARRDVAPFVKNRDYQAIWSRDFFRDVASRIISAAKSDAALVKI